MTSGREVQRLTSGERQEAGMEAGGEENGGVAAHEERGEEDERKRGKTVMGGGKLRRGEKREG